ncbi:MAG TPA: hypothetical protein VNO31_04560, partial [Umezawaea sp.]|nr:hypothetical protein [Umezawaea sp.]
LRRGFLPITAYSEVVSGRKNLIIGRKGSGKSAICMWLIENDRDAGSTCLITPDDAAGNELRRFELTGLTSPSAKALLWRYVIAVHAARYLVRHADEHPRRRAPSLARLERFLRDNNELLDSGLYHRISRAGRGMVSSMSLEAFGVKVGVDANGTPEGVRAGQQLEVLEGGVQQVFDELGCYREHRPMLVLVDQLEQVWSGEPESTALVVGLLLAGKHTALKYKGALRCVSFLRSDIYDSLDFGDADKFHGDEIRINWTERLLHRLALLRAGAALGRQLTPEELWGEVFPATVAGEPTPDYLFSRTLPRPRDAIQFLNQCRDVALDNGHHRITESDVLHATQVFSRWKRGDLAKEYGIRFPYLNALLVVFRDSGYEHTRTSIAETFLPFQSDLRSRYGDHDSRFDPDAIIELLFSIGFLGVRRRDGWVYAGVGGSTVQPHESAFCIHPCFRPALNTTTPRSGNVRNEITGNVVGAVVQAATIDGVSHGYAFGGDANTIGPFEKR